MTTQVKSYSSYFNDADKLAANIRPFINHKDKLYEEINNLIEITNIEIRDDSKRKHEKVITALTSEKIEPYLNGIPYEMNILRYKENNGAISDIRFTEEARWILFNKEVYKYDGKGIPYYFIRENRKEIAVGLNEIHKKLETELPNNSNIQRLFEETVNWENRLIAFSDEAKNTALELYELIKKENYQNQMEEFSPENYKTMISSMINNSVTDETKESLAEYFHKLSEKTENDEIKNLAEQVEIEIKKI